MNDIRAMVEAVRLRLRTEYSTPPKALPLRRLVILKPDDTLSEPLAYPFTESDARHCQQRYQRALNDVLLFERLPLSWCWIGGDMRL